MSIIDIAKEILGPEPGAALFILLALMIVLKAYVAEKNKNEKINAVHLQEIREDKEKVTTVLVESTAAINAFKEQNMALASAVNLMIQSFHQKRAGTGEHGDGSI